MNSANNKVTEGNKKRQRLSQLLAFLLVLWATGD
jgi:hypothetical protein